LATLLVGLFLQRLLIGDSSLLIFVHFSLFLTKVIASTWIAFGDKEIAIYGAILLQLGVLFDHMDGSKISRYFYFKGWIYG